MIRTQLTRKAACIAEAAHHGQIDKGCWPYIMHPLAVAERMTDEVSCAVALLHDVVEDTSVTFEDLSRQGFPPEVLEPLRLLTHDRNVPYMTYIETIKSHPVARAVKIADLRHNLDATRVEDAETVDRRKYGTALSLLLDGAGLARSYETDRLVLLSSDVELAVPVVDYLVRNRAFLESFEPLRPEVYFTLEGQRTELAKYAEQAEAGTEYRYWISLKNDPSRIIGMVGASGIVMGAFRSCYLSYKLDKTLLRRNLMTEALGRFVRALFDDAALHRVEANIMPRNLPSLAVARKLGFVEEGLSPKYLKINGTWEDHVHMVLLSDDEEVRR